MTFGPSLRRFGLAAHLATALAWLGAVAAFFALSVAALASGQGGVVRGCFVAMDVVGRYVIVPLSITAVIVGIAQALGTPWGLFRYYWVATKLVLTLGATGLLLLHQYRAVAAAAQRALNTPVGMPLHLQRSGWELAGDAGLALILLLAMTAIAVFKPWGLIVSRHAAGAGIPLSLKTFLGLVLLLAFVFGLLHHIGGSASHHHF